MTTIARSGGKALPAGEAWTMGLVSVGHFLSHFYALTLPPMFPLLRAEFGVSYAALGLAMACYALIGGVIQAPVGLLVDRLGARQVLLGGLALNAAAIALIGVAEAYWLVLGFAVLAGLGNSVFHPADYAIISGTVEEKRLGRAFSFHTFSGFFGSAVAPVAMTTAAAFAGWRLPFVLFGCIGLAVVFVMAARREHLPSRPRKAGKPDARPGPATPDTNPRSASATFLTGPILLFFAFHVWFGMASGGLSAFTATTLVKLYGLPLVWANAALTAYLFALAGGILFGGWGADLVRRHDISTAAALCAGALAVSVPAAAGLPEPAIVLLFGVVGLGMGWILPARDLMVRSVTPPGGTGAVFGFVFVGLSIGSGLAPMLFGVILDAGLPRLVFPLVAAFMLGAVACTMLAHRLARTRRFENTPAGVTNN